MLDMRFLSASLLLLASCGGDSFTEIISDPPVQSQITVRWSLAGDDGMAVSCRQAQAEEVEVSVGGVPVRVPCDDSDQQRVFEDLPTGRYPIVLRLLAASDNPLLEHFANVDLAEDPLSYEHTFVISSTSGNRGTLDVRWLLASEEAASACAAFGADRVVIESRPGSIADLQADLPCDAGRVEVTDLLRGDYTLRFSLLDVNRALLMDGVVQRVFRINPDQTTTEVISFPLVPAERATLRVEWTVNGDIGPQACSDVGAQVLSMELFQQESPTQEIPIRTATAACDRGLLFAPEINAAANPDLLGFRVSANLLGFAGLVLTSTTVSDVRLRRGQTSTVAFDLQVD